jgi:hypothetical protein
MIDFRRVFCDGANVERINFLGGIVGYIKKHAVSSVFEFLLTSINSFTVANIS